MINVLLSHSSDINYASRLSVGGKIIMQELRLTGWCGILEATMCSQMNLSSLLPPYMLCIYNLDTVWD